MSILAIPSNEQPRRISLGLIGCLIGKPSVRHAVVAGNVSAVQALREGLEVGVEEPVVHGVAREDLGDGGIERGVDGAAGEADVEGRLPGREGLGLRGGRVDEEGQEGLDEGRKGLGGGEAVVGGLVGPADDPGPEVRVLDLAAQVDAADARGGLELGGEGCEGGGGLGGGGLEGWVPGDGDHLGDFLGGHGCW